MTTSDYLEQLEQDREDFVDNLETKGITGLSGDETFTQLVPQVLNIPSGSGDDVSNYFNTEPSSMSSASRWVNTNYFIKSPPLKIPNTQTSLGNLCKNYTGLFVPKVIGGSQITNLSSMFNACSNIQEVDLSELDCSPTDTSSMFLSATSLTKIDIRKLDFTNTTSYSSMFGTSASNGPNNSCLIIVKDNTAKTWITSKFSRLTNVKTPSEL